MKNILIDLNGFIFWFFFKITSLLYKFQSYLLKNQYPKNHNIYFEIDGVIIKESDKNPVIRGALNNYTAQSVSILEDKRYNNFLVTLDLPFTNKEKAHKAREILKERFKKDKEIQQLNDNGDF
jgi:hypothetical protein